MSPLIVCVVCVCATALAGSKPYQSLSTESDGKKNLVNWSISGQGHTHTLVRLGRNSAREFQTRIYIYIYHAFSSPLADFEPSAMAMV